MNPQYHSETQKIELATAEAFFSLYNTQHNASYVVTRVAGDGEVPDVFAEDEAGNEFNLEITLTENRPVDIAALLGRSDSLSLETHKQHLEAVRRGEERLRITSLQDNVLPVLLQRINKKLDKRYGRNTALVVRDTGLLWEWEQVLPAIREHLKSKMVPFDLGIWLLASDKASVVQIHTPAR